MIIKFNELGSIRKNNKNKKIGICKGSFDIFHYSHLMLFKYIKNECDILVVILKNDNDVRKKGINRPIFNEKERLEMIDNIKFVDYVILQKDKEDTKLINTLIYSNKYSEKEIDKLIKDGCLYEKINADYLYVTEDKKIPKSIVDLCNGINLQIKIIPIQGNNFHTSDIINKIVS